MLADYYAMLGVAANAGRAEIEDAVARRQPEWSLKARDPREGHRYLGYLAQLPALRLALLSTDEARAAYDDSLRRAQLDAGRESGETLLKLVRLRAAKGGLTVRDRQILREEAESRGIAPAELARLLEPFPPWPEPPPEPDETELPGDVLDLAERQQLRGLMIALRRKHLYDVLDLAPDASREEIEERLEMARRDLRRGATHTEEGRLWQAALVQVQAHLIGAEARTRYDRTRCLEASEELERIITFTLRGVRKLDLATRDMLLQEAAGLGIGSEPADRVVRRVCRREGVAIEVNSAGIIPDTHRRWLRCRVCGGLTEYTFAEIHSSGQCRHCRTSLRWACPVCRQGLWVDEPRCRCGFRLADLQPMLEHFEAAQHAFRLRRYARAMTHLKIVQRYAPRHIGARKGIEKLQNHVREIRRLRAAYQIERAARRMVAAQAVLEQWSRVVSAHEARYRAAHLEVTAAIEKALDLVHRGRSLMDSDPAQARALLSRALKHVADLPEAQEALRRCPPDGPTNLIGESRGSGVHLHWTAPHPDGLGPVSYRVIRKPGAAPVHAEDGVHIADAPDPEWEDAKLHPGESFGYAVFSERDGVRSVLGVAAGPFVVTDEVSNLRSAAHAGEIRLTWRLPRGAIGARVVRRQGAPVRNALDGEAIEARIDGACDRNLTNGRVYYYRVFALFRGTDGKILPSKGVGTSAVPGEFSPPVGDLKAEVLADGVVTLGWTPPSNGRVRILRTHTHPGWLEGERLEVSAFDDREGDWIEPAGPGRALDVQRNGPALRCYTPLTEQDGSAVVGRSIELAHLLDPLDVRAVYLWDNPGQIALFWKGVERPGVGFYRVLLRSDRAPEGPHDNACVVHDIDAREFRARGFVQVEGPPRAQGLAWHVCVYSAAVLDSKPFFSAGREPTSHTTLVLEERPRVVWYRLTAPVGPGRRWSIAFRTQPSGGAFGPSRLVSAPRLLPLHVGEGQEVARFEPGQDGDTHSFTTPLLGAGRRVRLFVEPAKGQTQPTCCLPEAE